MFTTEYSQSEEYNSIIAKDKSIKLEELLTKNNEIFFINILPLVSQCIFCFSEQEKWQRRQN